MNLKPTKLLVCLFFFVLKYVGKNPGKPHLVDNHDDDNDDQSDDYGDNRRSAKRH